MELPKKNIKHIAMLEAVLFTTSEPLQVDDIRKMLKLEPETILMLIDLLKKRYAAQECGIKVSDVGGYRLAVKPEFMEKVSVLSTHADLSRGLLRVLSLIAYHEPVKQSDIVKVIGNRTYEYVKDLEKKGFVKSEVKGKTKLLRTTSQFETYFATRREELKKMVDKNEQKTEETTEEKT